MLIIFINVILVSQLEWGSFWFMSAANTHLSIINSLLCSAYKMAMGLPKSVASKVGNFLARGLLLAGSRD